MTLQFPKIFRIDVYPLKMNFNNKTVISESFPNEGRLRRMWQLFDEEKEKIINEMNEELVV